jgi:hypothetical protein
MVAMEVKGCFEMSMFAMEVSGCYGKPMMTEVTGSYIKSMVSIHTQPILKPFIHELFISN